VLRLCKRVAAYNICELANVDVIYEHVKERYDNAIKTLEKIAGMNDYTYSRIVVEGLPLLTDDPEQQATKPFRMVSRQKFNHE
jgi:hypothetical protein